MSAPPPEFLGVTSEYVIDLRRRNLSLVGELEVCRRDLAVLADQNQKYAAMTDKFRALAEAWDRSLFDCPCHRGCANAIRALLETP